MSTLQELIGHANPHLSLLRVGLSEAEYKKTSTMKPTERDALARRIIEKANDGEALKIIDTMVRLEFLADTNKPSLSNNRLAYALINAFMVKNEKNLFLPYYRDSIKRDHYTMADYPISLAVKSLWAIIRQAIDQLADRAPALVAFKDEQLPKLPLAFYQQLLPTPPGGAKLGAKPAELVTDLDVIAAFNQKLTTKLDVVPQAVEAFDMKSKLLDMKHHILNTTWKVGNYYLFSGGVAFEGKKYPHRVYDILVKLQALENDEAGALDPHTVFADIEKMAKEAIAKPHGFGRHADTTEFYKAIVEQRALGDDYIKPRDAEMAAGAGARM